jgi:hypothetical protein
LERNALKQELYKVKFSTLYKMVPVNFIGIK